MLRALVSFCPLLFRCRFLSSGSFCGRLRRPLPFVLHANLNVCNHHLSLYVFHLPERLNQGYSHVNCVFSADLQRCGNHHIGGFLRAGSGVSHLTYCKSDFLTVLENCQSVVRWDIGIGRRRIHCTFWHLQTSCEPTYCVECFPVFIVPAGHTLDAVDALTARLQG